MLAGATENAVCLLEFADRRILELQLRRVQKHFDSVFIPSSNPILEQLTRELEAYFNGSLSEFATPLAAPGTTFQQTVWNYLRTIPYGRTASYREVATALGIPKAVRAVARANGDNRLAIVIPCHRVIGNDGELTGYGGGLWRKRRLLDIETAGNRERGWSELFRTERLHFPF